MRRIILALMIAFAVPVATGGCSLLGITTAADQQTQNRQALTAAYAAYDTTKAILKTLADTGVLKGDPAKRALEGLQAASAALSAWASNPDNPNFQAAAKAAVDSVSAFEKSIPRPAAQTTSTGAS